MNNIRGLFLGGLLMPLLTGGSSGARAVMAPWTGMTTLAQSRRATTILNGGRRHEHDFCEGTDAEGQPA